MKILHKLSVLMCSIGLFSACTTIPLTSIPKLSALNPHTFDFSKAKVAVRVQEGFRVEDGDVKLTVNLFDAAKQQHTTETFEMLVEEMPQSDFLRKENLRGMNIYGFTFKESDMSRVLAFRDSFSAIAKNENSQAERGQNSFGININSQGCLVSGANPFQKMKVKIYLKPAVEGDYFTFVKEQKIDLAELNDGKIPACGS